LRQDQTHAEKTLWQALRDGKLDGPKFRRQYRIGRYFADFACVKLKLVVELDGGVHDDDENDLKDQFREEEIEQLGWFVLRFRNEKVIGDLYGVLADIRDHATRVRG
jgi:very-short-patch-repair endonuclease